MFVRTERLLLRPGWPEDGAALAAAVDDAAIARNTAMIPWPYLSQDADAFLALPERADRPRLLVFRRTAGAPRLIGAADVHDGAGGEPELGYWIARPFWGLGYATEAGRAMVELARRGLRLPRLVAGHALDNPASARVLAKLGFRLTGRVAERPSLGRGGPMRCAEMVLPF